MKSSSPVFPRETSSPVLNADEAVRSTNDDAASSKLYVSKAPFFPCVPSRSRLSDRVKVMTTGCSYKLPHPDLLYCLHRQLTFPLFLQFSGSVRLFERRFHSVLHPSVLAIERTKGSAHEPRLLEPHRIYSSSDHSISRKRIDNRSKVMWRSEMR